MAETALFIGWGSPRAGKETAAGKVFEESLAYWNGVKAAGEIESFEVVLLGAHGGDLTGFALLRGDPEKLGRLRMEPEVRRLTLRAAACLENVGLVDALVDAGALQGIALWKDATADLI